MEQHSVKCQQRVLNRKRRGSSQPLATKSRVYIWQFHHSLIQGEALHKSRFGNTWSGRPQQRVRCRSRLSNLTVRTGSTPGVAILDDQLAYWKHCDEL